MLSRRLKILTSRFWWPITFQSWGENIKLFGLILSRNSTFIRWNTYQKTIEMVGTSNFLICLVYSQTRLIQHYHKIPSGVLTHPSHPSLPPQSPSPPNPVPLPYSCLRLLLTEKVTRDFQDQNNRFLPFWEYRSLFTSRFVYWQDRIWNAKVKQLKLQYLLFPWRAQNIFRYLDRICSSDKQLGITP